MDSMRVTVGTVDVLFHKDFLMLNYMQVSLRLGAGAVIFQYFPPPMLDKVLSSAEVWLSTLHGAFQAAGASIK